LPARTRGPHQRAAATRFCHRGRCSGQQQRFIWKPGRTAGDYVKLAGLDEAARRVEQVHTCVPTAPSPAPNERGFFGFGGIDSQPLQPGDAVVVPNQLDYETWVARSCAT
jgi:hypothetical protein